MDTDDVFSYDILDWFPEAICENVFSHLSVADLKEASLVSRNWYSLIAKTSKCTSKMRLMFGWHATRKLTTEMKKMLKESPRKYEHFSLLHSTGNFEDITEILESPGRKWKTCRLGKVSFPSSPVYIKFMAALEPTIEDIHMNEVYVDSIYSDIENTMKFPKLRSLFTKHIQTLSYFKIFANCENLRSFDIQSIDHSWASMNGIRKILRNCKDLKMLSIKSESFGHFFDEDISKDIKFQLNEIHIYDLYDIRKDSSTNLFRFLQTQRLTVEKLEIGNWMDMKYLQLVTHMPRLTHFKMNGWHLPTEESEWKDANFHKNTSIKTVAIKDCFCRTFQLEVLLGATPNLENLVLNSVDDDGLRTITKLVPNLRSLETTLFQVKDVSDQTLLPKLERLTSRVYPLDLKVRRQDSGHFEDLVNTDMQRFFEESSEVSRYDPFKCCTQHHLDHSP